MGRSIPWARGPDEREVEKKEAEPHDCIHLCLSLPTLPSFFALISPLLFLLFLAAMMQAVPFCYAPPLMMG